MTIFVWLVRWATRGNPFYGHYGFRHLHRGCPWCGGPDRGRAALDILEERFARGEIEKAEFEDKRKLPRPPVAKIKRAGAAHLAIAAQAATATRLSNSTAGDCDLVSSGNPQTCQHVASAATGMLIPKSSVLASIPALRPTPQQHTLSGD
jgi:hypothetical protein